MREQIGTEGHTVLLTDNAIGDDPLSSGVVTTRRPAITPVGRSTHSSIVDRGRRLRSALLYYAIQPNSRALSFAASLAPNLASRSSTPIVQPNPQVGIVDQYLSQLRLLISGEPLNQQPQQLPIVGPKRVDDLTKPA